MFSAPKQRMAQWQSRMRLVSRDANQAQAFRAKGRIQRSCNLQLKASDKNYVITCHQSVRHYSIQQNATYKIH